MKKAVCLCLVFLCCFVTFSEALAIRSGMLNTPTLAKLCKNVDDIFDWLDESPIARANFCACLLKDLEASGFEALSDTKDASFFEERGLRVQSKTVGLVGYKKKSGGIIVYIRGADDLYYQTTYIAGESFGIFVAYGQDSIKAYSEAQDYASSTVYRVTDSDYKDLEKYLNDSGNKYYVSKKAKSSKTTAAVSEASEKEKGSTNSSDTNKTASLKIEGAETSIRGPFTGEIVIVEIGGNSYQIHSDFKDFMDQYEAYFDSIIAALQSLDKDDPNYLMKYMEFVQEALKLVDKADAVDARSDDLTEDEAMYCSQVIVRISQKMMDAAK